MATKTEFTLTTETFDRRVIKFEDIYAKRVYSIIADYLDTVREDADIIESKYPHILNPRRLRKLQPSTNGRLTSRTGKMNYMLKHVVSPWQTTAGGMVMKTSGLLVRVQKQRGASIMEFTGTMRPHLSMDGRLSSTGKGMPRETARTLILRLYWETGIRGQKRQYLFPQARKHFPDYANNLALAKEGML